MSDNRLQWTPENEQLLRTTICKEVSDAEFKLFLYTCKRTMLDPFSGQIHCLTRNRKQPDGSFRKEMTIQTGIDGLRVIAERTGQYAGQDAPIIGTGPKGLESATVSVYRIVRNQRVPFTATAYWDEYVQTGKDGKPMSMWAKMPKSQLSKCAESLALRKGFPNDLSGLYSQEEMQQAEQVDQATGEITNIQPNAPRESDQTPSPQTPAAQPPVNQAPQQERQLSGSATTAQIDLIMKLSKSHAVPYELLGKINTWMESADKQKQAASDFIEQLQAAIKNQSAPSSAPVDTVMPGGEEWHSVKRHCEDMETCLMTASVLNQMGVKQLRTNYLKGSDGKPTDLIDHAKLSDLRMLQRRLVATCEQAGIKTSEKVGS